MRPVRPVRIVPHLTFARSEITLPRIETDAGAFVTSAWISAAPNTPEIIGPVSLFGKDGARSLHSGDKVDNAALNAASSLLSEILTDTGFDAVREDGFPDQIFVADGVCAVAYETVAEHLPALSDDAVDSDGRVLDPILSRRALSLLVARDVVADDDGRAHFDAVIAVLERVLFHDVRLENVTVERCCLDPTVSAEMQVAQVEWLRKRWRRLTDRELPAAALTRKWPVSQDHCFARILLDHAFGGPWREVIAAPAWRNAPPAALIRAVLLGERVLAGQADLTALNATSLEMRGKLNDRR